MNTDDTNFHGFFVLAPSVFIRLTTKGPLRVRVIHVLKVLEFYHGLQELIANHGFSDRPLKVPIRLKTESLRAATIIVQNIKRQKKGVYRKKRINSRHFLTHTECDKGLQLGFAAADAAKNRRGVRELTVALEEPDWPSPLNC